jgi:hypothetical protein
MFKNFPLQNHAVYEILWKNRVELGRPQLTVWCMHFVCWMPMATNIHSEYVILIAFPLQQWLHDRTSMLHYSTLPVLIYLVYVCQKS